MKTRVILHLTQKFVRDPFHSAHSSEVKHFYNKTLGSYILNKRSGHSFAMETGKDCDVSKLLLPPICVKGMKTLDRDVFQKKIEVPSLLIPIDKFPTVFKKLKPYVLKMKKLPNVLESTDGQVVLLNPVLFQSDSSVIQNCIDDSNLGNIFWKEIKLGYENFTQDSIMKAIIPAELGDNVSGFSVIGHIIHFNLKSHLMDFKYVIGQVFLDKFPNIRTVVNKVNIIDDTFRNFEMEILAGEPDFIVQLKENYCRYEFDFSKVFWNPRLTTEHMLIVERLHAGDIVYDVFAGVGPFAIPASKKKCHVYANDLNPNSYKWLCHSAKLNKVHEKLKAYNLDGRDFIRTVIKNGLTELWQKSTENPTVHIIMNLPAIALDFLDAFRNLLPYTDNIKEIKQMPIVYCYFFHKKNEDSDDKQKTIDKYFDAEMQHCIIEIELVRLVAPNKEMFRVTFTLPKTLLFAKNEENDFEHKTKKIKLVHE